PAPTCPGASASGSRTWWWSRRAGRGRLTRRRATCCHRGCGHDRPRRRPGGAVARGHPRGPERRAVPGGDSRRGPAPHRRRLRVQSRAEILVFLRERIFELGLERYLPLGSPDEHLDALLTLFDRARDEDVSPEEYRAFAERLAAGAADEEERDRAAAQRELGH